MGRFYIDDNLSFKEAVYEVKALKPIFNGVLASFSYFNIKYKVDYIYWCREVIYRLKIDEWQKERLWEFLNDDIELELLYKLAYIVKKDNK